MQPMGSGHRQVRSLRLAQEFQEEIALIIQRQLKDPRMGFVTITRVELSRDGSHAKVFFSCLGGIDERTRSQEALDHAAPFIYGLIKKRFHIKVIPQLSFCYDESIARSIEISSMLDRLNEPSS